MDRDMLEQILGYKLPPSSAHGKGVKGWVDLVTLLAVLSGGTLWGLIALGIVPVHLDWPMRIICGFIGLSTIWQLCRQRLW
jgi:hypothetical protein